MAYKRTAVGIKNVTRSSRTVDRLVGDYGGADADEVQVLNGLVALGYDPALIRSFSDADPDRRFLGDAVARALRAGVKSEDIDRALRYNKVAVEDHSSLRGLHLAEALGFDANKVSAEANRLAGMQGRREPTADQWAEAAARVGGLNPDAARSFTSYARSEHADFVGKDVQQGAPPGAPAPAGTSAAAPAPGRVLPGDVRAVETQQAKAAAKPPAQSLQQPKPGPAGTLGGTLGGGEKTAPASAGLRALPTLDPNAPPDKVMEYIRKWYGFTAWTLDIPELREQIIQLARDFAGTEINELTVEGRLKNTQWWKTHEGDQRLAIEEKMSDPATYNAKVEGKFRTLASLAGQIGFQPNEARLRQMAIQAYDGGWNEAEMRAGLSAEFDYNPDTGQEDQSAIVGDLRQIASDYLVPLSEQTIDQWGRQIVAGTANNEAFTQYAKNMAKGMFSHYASDIDAGRTVKQIADPFVQVAARDLELTEDQIDLMDSKWRRALENDPETGQPMQLSKWQRLIRTDSGYGWDSTQNARAEASEFARKIAESFGRA